VDGVHSTAAATQTLQVPWRVADLYRRSTARWTIEPKTTSFCCWNYSLLFVLRIADVSVHWLFFVTNMAQFSSHNIHRSAAKYRLQMLIYVCWTNDIYRPTYNVVVVVTCMSRWHIVPMLICPKLFSRPFGSQIENSWLPALKFVIIREFYHFFKICKNSLY